MPAPPHEADRHADPRGRVLVAKLGLDGHDVGAKVVARLLRDRGFEVIYLGIRQTPEAVASVAVDEDVDMVGVSMLSGAHLPLVTRLVALLRERRWAGPIVVGGVIPAADRAALAAAGVAAVVDAATTPAEIVETVDRLVRAGRRAADG
ncbi:MAG TPA: cobalamin-dependent protein [Acidimicrobiales bacterium]